MTKNLLKYKKKCQVLSKNLTNFQVKMATIKIKKFNKKQILQMHLKFNNKIKINNSLKNKPKKRKE